MAAMGDLLERARRDGHTFWLVIVTYPSGRQIEVEPDPDNRKEARRMARYFTEERGAIGATVVKRIEWERAA